MSAIMQEVESVSAHLAKWLSERDRTTARPVVVAIDGDRYPGAFFDQVRDHDPSSRAYRDGARTYHHRALYLLGEPPAARAHGYVTQWHEGDAKSRAPRVWYSMGGWSPEDFVSRAYVREADGTTRPQTLADVEQYHPFGAYFMLGMDDVGVTLTDWRGSPRAALNYRAMIVREVTS